MRNDEQSELCTSSNMTLQIIRLLLLASQAKSATTDD